MESPTATTTWETHAKENAKHRALIHLECNNPEKMAAALNEIPVLESLEYLFKLAEKHRKQKKFQKTKIILEAAELIDRQTGDHTELTVEIDDRTNKKETTVMIERLTPAQVFSRTLEDEELDVKDQVA